MALTGNLDVERRRQQLVAMAQEPNGVQLETAAATFGVSSMTIRRDILELESEGRVRRVRGGAVGAPTARPFDARLAIRASAKRTIAQKALRHVADTGVIAFDASTTVMTLAAMLGTRSGLTVCTNSVESFSTLSPVAGVTAVLTGGTAEPTTGSLVGPIARRSASALYYDRFFCSADALDAAEGTSEVSAEEAEVKLVMSAQAGMTLVCVDSGKLSHRSIARALESSQIDVLITELDPADARLDAFRHIPLVE